MTWWPHMQSQKYLATDLLWWRGLARIMENKGYIREGDDRVCSWKNTYIHVRLLLTACVSSSANLLRYTVSMQTHVQIKFLEPTKRGLEFIKSGKEQSFNAFPEADMLLAASTSKSYSTFLDWGKGWADPEIRRQRLQSMGRNRGPRKSRKLRTGKSRKSNRESHTARGRIASKLSKKKWTCVNALFVFA